MFKALRRYYWLTQSFIQKHSKIIVRSTLSVLSLLTIFFLFARYLPTPKNTFKIGRVGKYTATTIPHDIEQKVGVGLVTITDNGEIKPALATTWEITDNGTKYQFNLDTNTTWHDGSNLLPRDINYNFEDVLVESTVSSVTYTLKEPFAPFMHTMTKPILKDHRFGTLDYRLIKTKVVAGVLQALTLENDSERLIYKFYPTEASAITAYKLGEVEILENVSQVTPELKSDTATTISEPNKASKIVALFMNNSDTVLGSKTTRQGLAYAIPNKSFDKTRALSPISKNSWAYNNLVKDYDYDLEKAKSLFSQDIKNPSEIKIELKTMLPYLDIAESIASAWREKLGIQVDVKVVSAVTSDYQIILADFTPPADPDQYSLWHSTQPTNFTHYSNLKVDKLLEDGRRTLDQKLRREIYQDFQRFLLEDSPAIFLFETSSFTLSRQPFF